MNASISPLEVGLEAGEGRHDLAAGIDLHGEAPAAHLADEVPQLLG